MSLTCVQPCLYIGTKDGTIHFCNQIPWNSKLRIRILTVDSEPGANVNCGDGVVRKHIYCLDEPQADLLSFFDECAEFISRGLQSGQSVIVHCWAGESRSATVILAHLMKTSQMSLVEAMDFLKKVYPKANPNSGFCEQLQLYEAMGYIVDRTNPAYKQYRLKILANKIKCHQFVTKDLLSPLIDQIKHKRIVSEKMFKCKKCRFMLFDADDLIGHETGHVHSSAFKWRKRGHQAHVGISEDNPCTSLFIEPVNWMLQSLVGNVEGKLSCPKCKGRLGSFSWAGMQCSCGQWVTPAFQVHKNKVDETWRVHEHTPTSSHPTG